MSKLLFPLELEFEHDYGPVEIDPKELVITKRLGEGNFGFVYKGEINNVFGRIGKTVVAIKVLKGMVNFRSKLPISDL